MEHLPKYLLEHLLEALRRDMRREQANAIQSNDDTNETRYHAANVRLSQKILECLRPKNSAQTCH
jgi:hypothetical protein